MRTLNSWLTIGIQCWMGILSAKFTHLLCVCKAKSIYTARKASHFFFNNFFFDFLRDKSGQLTFVRNVLSGIPYFTAYLWKIYLSFSFRVCMGSISFILNSLLFPHNILIKGYDLNSNFLFYYFTVYMFYIYFNSHTGVIPHW